MKLFFYLHLISIFAISLFVPRSGRPEKQFIPSAFHLCFIQFDLFFVSDTGSKEGGDDAGGSSGSLNTTTWKASSQPAELVVLVVVGRSPNEITGELCNEQMITQIVMTAVHGGGGAGVEAEQERV